MSCPTRFFAHVIGAIGGLVGALHAQALTPPVAMRGALPPTVTPTAAEALINLDFEAQRTANAVLRVTQAHYPKDSLDMLAAQRAQTWLAALPRTAVTGIQVDPYGQLAVIANQDAIAEHQIDTRLATPGLSIADRAYTLETAVRAFASAGVPARLTIAERYLAQLDALGSGVALWQFRARGPLINTYYRLGRRADVARLGVRALMLIGEIPFSYRHVFYGPDAGALYGPIVDAVSGEPHGRDTVRALNAQLLRWTTPPSALVALDSMSVWEGEFWQRGMTYLAAMSERINAPGTPLIANYWVNRGPSRDSQMVAVNDGKIRVLEIGSFSCAPCMAAVSGLERLHQRYPAVEFNFLTATMGSWGNRLIAPRAEADRLAEHFLTVKHITFPIGIALLPRVTTEDGGAELVESTPTWHADRYPQIDKPTFYILDGHGIIRRVIAGYTRDVEPTIAAVIEFLQRES